MMERLDSGTHSAGLVTLLCAIWAGPAEGPEPEEAPGPGEYNVQRAQPEGPSYSIAGKVEPPKPDPTPAAGAYNVPPMWQEVGPGNRHARDLCFFMRLRLSGCVAHDFNGWRL